MKLANDTDTPMVSQGWMKQDAWTVEQAFSAQSRGQVRLDMPVSHPTLKLRVQLDEQGVKSSATTQADVTATADTDTPDDDADVAPTAATEVELLVDQLTDAEAGPHTLTAEVPSADATADVKDTADDADDVASTPADVATELTDSGVMQAPLTTSRIGGSGNPTSLSPTSETDPYAYTPDSDGRFPTSYNDATSANVRNYNYGKNENKSDQANAVMPYIWSSRQLNFDDGFLDYNGAGLRKWATPVANTTDQFDINLEIIGNSILPKPKVDIVLVLDKSSSMGSAIGNTNNAALISAVRPFIQSIFAKDDQLDARIGIVSFHGTTTTKTSGLLSTAGSLTNQEALTMTGTGYTPMSRGLKEGTEMLLDHSTARADAKKYLLFFGDGGSNRGYAGLANSRERNAGYFAMKNLVSPGIASGNMISTDDWYYTGYGSNVSNIGSGTYGDKASMLLTTSYIHYLKTNGAASWLNQEVTAHAVAYNVAGNANEQWWAKNTIANIPEGTGGSFLASSNAAELQDYFDDLVEKLTNTVKEATVTDPLSDYVDLVTPPAIEKASFKLGNTQRENWTGAAAPSTNMVMSYDADSNIITASNLEVGKNQGVRITYRVKLKEAYHNGTFYPANKATYLVNGKANAKTDRIHFAVPSVRVPQPTVNFTLKKQIAGSSVGLAGAKFQLFTAETGGTAVGAEVTSTGNGTLAFTDIAPGTYWLRETATPSNFLPGEPVQITVNRDGSVTGLTNNIVENTRKPIDVTLSKKDGNALLPGATFVLKNGNAVAYTLTGNQGVHSAQNVAPGVYTLVETVAPAGYELIGEIGTLTVSVDGTVTYKLKGASANATIQTNNTGVRISITLPEVQNELKDFVLNLEKYDMADKSVPLEAAEFELYTEKPGPLGGTAKATATTNANGKAVFMKDATTVYPLTVGSTYYIKEVTSPDSYELLTGLITLTVTSKTAATITYDGPESGAVSATVDVKLNSGADLNTLTFKAYNQEAPEMLPSTGGPGIQGMIAIAMVLMMTAGMAWLWLRRPGMEVR
ncbi:vWA domain-containing protein [Lacticaseibacillus daqingensis]|uniref:vWA domain-containing protein n=1 Tax=Lacticaseibacillus daqingensis TaxID=2486014 RepID=UPI0013DE16DA|nr:SpaA isopeptide-forming pilin-related protein [Lacticaseibacillus daqingensis]